MHAIPTIRKHAAIRHSITMVYINPADSTVKPLVDSAFLRPPAKQIQRPIQKRMVETSENAVLINVSPSNPSERNAEMRLNSRETDTRIAMVREIPLPHRSLRRLVRGHQEKEAEDAAEGIGG